MNCLQTSYSMRASNSLPPTSARAPWLRKNCKNFLMTPKNRNVLKMTKRTSMKFLRKFMKRDSLRSSSTTKLTFQRMTSSQKFALKNRSSRKRPPYTSLRNGMQTKRTQRKGNPCQQRRLSTTPTARKTWSGSSVLTTLEKYSMKT